MAEKKFKLSLTADGHKDPVFEISLGERPFFLICGVAAIAVLVFILSLLYSTYVTRKVVSYQVLKEKTITQSKQIDDFFSQTEALMKRLEEVNQKENQVRRMLGLRSTKMDMSLLKNDGKPTEKVMSKNIFVIKQNLETSGKSLGYLMQFVSGLRERFPRVPSIWPVYGQVMSTFGYRISPWRGFHSGIDIEARYGTSVKVAADGKVSFVGWKSGYGKTVVIDHGAGTTTLYGHLSGYAAVAGKKVKKGQVIGYVGMTGYTTGPHLHYEVRKNDAPVDPRYYLDLNILKAY